MLDSAYDNINLLADLPEENIEQTKIAMDMMELTLLFYKKVQIYVNATANSIAKIETSVNSVVRKYVRAYTSK